MTVGEVIKMFVERLTAPPREPMRVCRKCFKRDRDEAIYLAFDRPGDCARCSQTTQPRDSVAIVRSA